MTRSREPGKRVHLQPLDPGMRLNAVPAAEVVAEMEAEDPRAVAEAGLSSAAMRAGDLVREMRRESGLSQAQLAERIGVSQARIAELEAGRGPQGPTWDVMDRVAKACGRELRIATAPGEVAEPMGAADGTVRRFAAEGFALFDANMQLPSLSGMDAFLSAYSRNLQTLSAANRVAIEGAQAVTRRHMEFMQQNMFELSETIAALASSEAPQTKFVKQAELLKKGYERAVSNMKELSDLLQYSSGKALELLDHRFTESRDEVNAQFQKAGTAER